MDDRLLSGLLKVYRRLPVRGRRLALRLSTPSFRVGSSCVLERPDGALLMVRTSYRRHPGWGFPGGHINRNERPEECVVREMREELGVEVTVGSDPVVMFSPRFREVTFIFRCALSAAEANRPIRPNSPEIHDVGWFEPDSLPTLLPETEAAMAELSRVATDGMG